MENSAQGVEKSFSFRVLEKEKQKKEERAPPYVEAEQSGRCQRQQQQHVIDQWRPFIRLAGAAPFLAASLFNNNKKQKRNVSEPARPPLRTAVKHGKTM